MYQNSKRRDYRDLSLPEVRAERMRLKNQRDAGAGSHSLFTDLLIQLDIRERQILLMRM